MHVGRAWDWRDIDSAWWLRSTYLSFASFCVHEGDRNDSADLLVLKARKLEVSQIPVGLGFCQGLDPILELLKMSWVGEKLLQRLPYGRELAEVK